MAPLWCTSVERWMSGEAPEDKFWFLYLFFRICFSPHKKIYIVNYIFDDCLDTKHLWCPYCVDHSKGSFLKANFPLSTLCFYLYSPVFSFSVDNRGNNEKCPHLFYIIVYLSHFGCVRVFSSLRLLCGAFCYVFVLFFEVQFPLSKELQKVLFHSQRSLISVSNQLASRCHYVLLKLSFS